MTGASKGLGVFWAGELYHKEDPLVVTEPVEGPQQNAQDNTLAHPRG
jgi:hypothetical protein